jgi:hypothetical protein
MNEQKTEQPADPLIDDVRAVRRAISEEVGHDLQRLVVRLRAIEEQYSSRLVRAPKRPSDARWRHSS